tara:strand:+ start:133 stop:771 length:639 start_codon:yes stop_codon:yes gene_type:complete
MATLREYMNAKLKKMGKSVSEAKKGADKYKSIAAAKKAGSLYYTNKDGKVMAAVSASDLKKPVAAIKPKKKPLGAPKKNNIITSTISATGGGRGDGLMETVRRKLDMPDSKKSVKKKTAKKKSPRGAMDKAPAGHGFELSPFTTLMGQKRKTALDRFAPDAASDAQVKRNMSKVTKAEWSAMTMKQRKDVGLPTTELQIKRRSGLNFKDFKK